MESKLRLKLRIPLYILTKTGLAYIFGFKNIIKILTLFTFDNSWANYLIHREESDYFNISKILFNGFPPGLRVLDIGCGAGNLLKEYKSPVVAIDKSAMNLYLAKYFFARMGDRLILADAENKLPSDDGSFDVVHLNDTFQYLKNKEGFIKESRRILRKNGILIAVHTHKFNLFKDVGGIIPSKAKKLFKKNGFENVCIESDTIAYINLMLGGGLTDNTTNLDGGDKTQAFTLIAGKKFNLPLMSGRYFSEYVFISPHFDDAVLSAGELISKLADAGKKVKVISVFTKEGKKPYPEFAAEFVKSSGYKDAHMLFKNRITEDANALKCLNVQGMHLGFIDAAFRKKGKGIPIYDYNTLFSGNISRENASLLIRIKKALKKIVKKDSLIIAPLGVGGHVDHIMVRQAVSELDNKKIYWEDFPYSQNNSNRLNYFSKVPDKYKKFMVLKSGNTKKYQAINCYRSQLSILFPKGPVPVISETYFLDA